MSPKSAKTKTTGVFVQKPSTNVYTTMLILSLVAIIVGIIMLNLALRHYGDWPQWKATASAIPGMAPAVASFWT